MGEDFRFLKSVAALFCCFVAQLLPKVLLLVNTLGNIFNSLGMFLIRAGGRGFMAGTKKPAWGGLYVSMRANHCDACKYGVAR